MANSAQAKKRARQSEKRRQHNASRRSMLRTYIKKVVKAIDNRNSEEARVAYQVAVPIIDRMASKGIIHKNKAARHKSRLYSRIRTIEIQAAATTQTQTAATT
ncbi:Ribosomal protein S20 [Beggiatoa sp. PS]|nr:Ribosomal protein S20 [Beggiatoa sp. PS]